jgi:hypothetical protein
MYRGANIMDKSGAGKLRASEPTPRSIGRFQDNHRFTRLCQGYRSGQTIGPRAHNNRVVSMVGLIQDFALSSFLSIAPAHGSKG